MEMKNEKWRKFEEKNKQKNWEKWKIFFYIETINFKVNENDEYIKQETNEHNYDEKYLL